MRMKKSEEEWKVKAQMRRGGMYLWDLRNGRHCWSGWFLSLNLQTLGGRFGCVDGGGTGLFLGKR